MIIQIIRIKDLITILITNKFDLIIIQKISNLDKNPYIVKNYFKYKKIYFLSKKNE